VVPFRDRGGDPLRAANLERVRNHWRHSGIPFLIVDDGRHGDDLFNRSAAYNRAAAATDADVLMFIEVDILLSFWQIDEAVKMARATPGLVVPYARLCPLSEADSELVRGYHKQPGRCQSANCDEEILGPANVVSRETLAAVGGGYDETFCVDEATEILTRRGWRHHRDVSVGDQVLTLNHATGLSEWQPVEAVNVFSGVHEMVSIESPTHSSLTTANHRWPVIRGDRKRLASGEMREYRWRTWKTTDKFATGDQVPIIADCADLPLEPKYIDALVEIVGWFWTEGHIVRLRDGRRSRNVIISQSAVANPDNCDLIISALTRLFGHSSEFPRRGPMWGKRVCVVCGTEFEGGSGQAKYCSDTCRPPNGRKPSWRLLKSAKEPDIPRWRMQRSGRTSEFILNAEAGEIVQSLAPNRVPSHGFLMSLTRAQLLLFIETSMLGDGYDKICWYSPNGIPRVRQHKQELGQKDPIAADAFQFACILAGIATSTSTSPVMPKYGYGMTTVALKKSRNFKPANGIRTNVTLEGDVWCPTTANGTWLARRRGKVYFTGNSGHGFDDLAMTIAFEIACGPVRRVQGPAYHLAHLNMNPDIRAGMSERDIEAHARNAERWQMYLRAETPEQIRILTSGGSL
jgi:predicted nucleic acid-binding Zn ribbon protein